MNLIWIVFIFATAAVGVYLYVTTMHAEKLKRRPGGGERIDLRPDGTVVNSDPEASTPGDIGYVAPPAHHYTPPSPTEAGAHGGHAHDAGGGAFAGHDSGSFSNGGGFDAGSGGDGGGSGGGE